MFEHMLQQPELVAMCVLRLIKNDERKPDAKTLGERRVFAERAPRERGHVGVAIEPTLDHRGLEGFERLPTIGVGTPLPFPAAHGQRAGLRRGVRKGWVQIEKRNPLLEPALQLELLVFGEVVEDAPTRIPPQRLSGEGIVIDLARVPAQAPKIGQGEILVYEGCDRAGEMGIGHQPRCSRMTGDQVFDLGPRGVGMRDDADAAPPGRPVAREQRELRRQQRGLAVAGRRLHVTGSGLRQEVDLARIGEITAAQLVTKLGQQFGRERQDLEHAATPSPPPRRPTRRHRCPRLRPRARR
ncbi:hypothetical protein L0C21_04035 [Sphingosinicellaceae bacterium A1X5R2]|nr:hypothetical protein [Pedomonas mirosovicensis]MCH8684468.1 hypothetical protein [Pedomonas mirosovicensis]